MQLFGKPRFCETRNEAKRSDELELALPPLNAQAGQPEPAPDRLRARRGCFVTAWRLTWSSGSGLLGKRKGQCGARRGLLRATRCFFAGRHAPRYCFGGLEGYVVLRIFSISHHAADDCSCVCPRRARRVCCLLKCAAYLRRRDVALFKLFFDFLDDELNRARADGVLIVLLEVFHKHLG